MFYALLWIQQECVTPRSISHFNTKIIIVCLTKNKPVCRVLPVSENVTSHVEWLALCAET